MKTEKRRENKIREETDNRGREREEERERVWSKCLERGGGRREMMDYSRLGETRFKDQIGGREEEREREV
jgi:hypothetical protein